MRCMNRQLWVSGSWRHSSAHGQDSDQQLAPVEHSRLGLAGRRRSALRHRRPVRQLGHRLPIPAEQPPGGVLGQVELVVVVDHRVDLVAHAALGLVGPAPRAIGKDVEAAPVGAVEHLVAELPPGVGELFLEGELDGNRPAHIHLQVRGVRRPGEGPEFVWRFVRRVGIVVAEQMPLAVVDTDVAPAFGLVEDDLPVVEDAVAAPGEDLAAHGGAVLAGVGFRWHVLPAGGGRVPAPHCAVGLAVAAGVDRVAQVIGVFAGVGGDRGQTLDGVGVGRSRRAQEELNLVPFAPVVSVVDAGEAGAADQPPSPSRASNSVPRFWPRSWPKSTVTETSICAPAPPAISMISPTLNSIRMTTTQHHS